ncbi:hypothetical protein ACFZCY_30330 [Streptomyces sp. NPDC007983]|uniref:hypothetical protein n=1 Tax=Streptomyces sp. NPDC007983 TaxID=3364800 RepID=UPI0036E0B968
MNEPMPGGRPGPELDPEPEAGPAAEPAEAALGPSGVPVATPSGPADPAPLGVGRTPTGVPDVDTRLDRLADADDLPVSGHLEVYEDVHRGLRDTLTALDRRPGPPAPPAPSS